MATASTDRTIVTLSACGIAIYFVWWWTKNHKAGSGQSSGYSGGGGAAAYPDNYPPWQPPQNPLAQLAAKLGLGGGNQNSNKPQKTSQGETDSNGELDPLDALTQVVNTATENDLDVIDGPLNELTGNSSAAAYDSAALDSIQLSGTGLPNEGVFLPEFSEDTAAAINDAGLNSSIDSIPVATAQYIDTSNNGSGDSLLAYNDDTTPVTSDGADAYGGDYSGGDDGGGSGDYGGSDFDGGDGGGGDDGGDGGD